MRLVRYRPTPSAAPLPGVLDDDAIQTVATKTTEDPFASVLQTVTTGGPGRIETDGSVSRDQVEILSPISSVGRVFCLGAIYTGHMEDEGLSLTFDPNQWVMPENAIIGPDDPIVLPERVADNVMPAAELCIVVGKSGKYIDPTDAYDYIAGYTISNDVTARTDWPGPMGYKMMDGFSPVGPFVRTADDVSDPADLTITIHQDGEQICRGSTAGMRFTLSFLLSYLSTITELRPGDIISTGDPGGVEKSLAPGSEVEATIEHVGTLRNPVVLE